MQRPLTPPRPAPGASKGKVSPDGPIPGSNLLSDTRNYPWHRPPEHPDLDGAIEAAVKHITQKKATVGILALVEAGADIASITDMLLTDGIGKGKWTPDTAILAAGPVARIIEILAKGYGLNYRLGIEDDDSKLPTAEMFARMAPTGIDRSKATQAAQEARGALGEVQAQAEAQKPSGGLMGAPTGSSAPAPKTTQDKMLGRA